MNYELTFTRRRAAGLCIVGGMLIGAATNGFSGFIFGLGVGLVVVGFAAFIVSIEEAAGINK